MSKLILIGIIANMISICITEDLINKGFNNLNKTGQSFIRSIDNDAYRHIARSLQSTCDSFNCPPTQGYCKGDRCICLEGYLTVIDKDNFKYCNYEQKKTMWSLLFESFGFIGVGHFYAGRIWAGILKLVLFYVIICYGSQFVITFMKENTDTDTAYYIKLIISASCLSIPVLWHLVDLYKFATNQYLDGNAMPMLNW